jgi:uncharacterized protein YlxW (UPF0749 family)
MDLDKEIPDERFTQKDLFKLLLHSAQHVATREELKDVETKLDARIDKLETTIKDVETKLETKIKDVGNKLDQVETKLETKIDKVENKLNRLQFLIVAGVLALFFKDVIHNLF